MKIAITSDLHMEFRKSQLPRLEDRVDVLILAGDIDNAKRVNDTAKLVANGHADVTIGIAGNHEFYGSRIDKALAQLRAAPDITFLENDSVTIDGVVFIGSTLWTDYQLNGNAALDMFRIQDYMNDYKTISINADGAYRRFLPRDAQIMHYDAKEYIRKRLEETAGQKQVVITHHAPSGQSINEQYVGEWANCGYASNVLDGYFPEPSLWVHGHMHDPVDYMAGNTRVMSFPRGYPGEFEETYPFGVIEL